MYFWQLLSLDTKDNFLRINGEEDKNNIYVQK
jgi:hypothetical protein